MNAPVNIVYPVNGASYPLVDPAPGGVKSAYVTFSFSTTCPGGGNQVEWGVDGQTLGKADYYDQYSAQFVWKLPGGTHVFWVRSSCGQDKVQFQVG